MKKLLVPSFGNFKFNKSSDKKNIVVLMSGGVDSSAAALLFKREGMNVAGVTMNISDDSSACESAAKVCEALSIPHFYTDIADEFRACVSSPFCEAYLLGRTPNPCADCNERIKFGLLWDMIEESFGDDLLVSTGHYAKIIRREGKAYLARSSNRKKDQSYFMSGIKKARIAKMVLPLSDFTKEETRAFVRSEGLPVAERPESMEICFASESDYRRIIEAPSVHGPITDPSGKVIGEHTGIANYTLGQRKGLGIAWKKPLFVTEIRPCDNTIVASEREAAFSDVVRASGMNIQADEFICGGSVLYGKIRSQGEPEECTVTFTSDGTAEARFKKPVFAPAPGQRLVLYTGEGILAAGGSII